MSGIGNLKTTFTESYNFGGLSVGGVLGTVNTNNIEKFDDTLPANLTDHVVSFGADIADSQVQGIDADQDCTVKTYLSTTLVNTITLKAKVSQFWSTLKNDTLKIFTGNFDSIKVTTGSNATRIKIAISNNIGD